MSSCWDQSFWKIYKIEFFEQNDDVELQEMEFFQLVSQQHSMIFAQFPYGKTMIDHPHLIAMFLDEILPNFLQKVGHVRSVEHQWICWAHPMNDQLQIIRNNPFNSSTTDTSLHLYFIDCSMRITINQTTNFFNMFSCCFDYRS